MLASRKQSALSALLLFCLSVVYHTHAQSGTSTSVAGTVVDTTGAVVPGAAVEVKNPVSGLVDRYR